MSINHLHDKSTPYIKLLIPRKSPSGKELESDEKVFKNLIVKNIPCDLNILHTEIYLKEAQPEDKASLTMAQENSRWCKRPDLHKIPKNYQY